ncbi:nuclear transport factor 2 family protein [Brumimicrobium mesophilum]|uniref:nuclear transport factor 2 family protein n=1 Tax=Brumimicrobium mesophilum TaxID=392717 RepID=UPI000D14153E|nr:nuclear transport factor 2 family protein [Brumimicrobium mesophilum]
MKLSIKEIAENFSKGEFERVTDFLSENVVWNIVGENKFQGKNAVIKNCNQTATYFKTIDTDFRTKDVLVLENKVIITGTAEFSKGGEILNLISACDFYHFNENEEIIEISSYCIQEKRN